MALTLSWILLMFFFALSCNGVDVLVRENKKFATLFQSVVLPCQYSTPSTQKAVVQWWYKSYCTDRTRDSFSFPESLGVRASELGSKSHLECADSTRTVHIVASGQGASQTLSPQYKGRDISIINQADLRIGELQWGDSGVYYCKVVIADDVVGQNEAYVELLVMGRTGELDDILPEFDMEIMPEWLFVGAVVLGSILFLLLVGICWCQCCPHSCCCYVRCCCCPETCCCPRHLYEAGKMIKSTQPTPIPMYAPYYLPGVPTIVPQPSLSVIEPKMASVPPSVDHSGPGVRSGYRLQSSQGQDSMKVVYYIEKELAQFQPTPMTNHKSAGSVSELSSLHEGDTDFRQTYRQVQRKALPPISDFDDEPRVRTGSTSHGHRSTRYPSNHSEEHHDGRWNPRSEHLQRKAFGTRGRTGSLDELEEFARSYGDHGRRGEARDLERDYDLELRPRDNYPTYRAGSPRRYRDDDGGGSGGWHSRHSPPPSPRKRRDTADSERRGPRSNSYDDTFLNALLERKARGGRGARGEGDDSDTPSKGSSKKSSDCYYSRSPSNRPEEDDPLPPYTELVLERNRALSPPKPPDRYRTVDPSTQPFSYTRPANGQSMAHTLQERRDDRDKSRKVNTHLSRDSLIV
ncbi:immunoglobulin-like domain-containing receptor 2 isoform X1 [Alosa sapidissima]|uniref:immunoglobulin-like domain-containing receptor 2 isoform X1 n=1 Tax=Alosa sapidissima TaxID=34773 RepID=UPI001C08813B|nr:immunoglobulin-like domain-containing receptor 2 isoform X1 [Alosa sapidissima]